MESTKKIPKGQLDLVTTQKTITGNVTLDNTYSDTIVKIKANATITINTGLKTNFNCVFRTFTGATAVFSFGAGVTSDAPTGLNLVPLKMATLFKDGAIETYILTGETS